jgi:hypothetical protein
VPVPSGNATDHRVANRQPVIWFPSALRADNSRHNARSNSSAWPKEIRPCQSLRRRKHSRGSNCRLLLRRVFLSLFCTEPLDSRFWDCTLVCHPQANTCSLRPTAPPITQPACVLCSDNNTIAFQQPTFADFSTFLCCGRPLLKEWRFLPARSPVAAATSTNFRTDPFPMSC